MAIYGYSRVSDRTQNLSIQEEALRAAGCEVIRSEKVSGTSMNNRDELRNLLDFIREGDELVITRIDRLARSILDLHMIVEELEAKGATLRATEQPISTGDAASKAFLSMLGVFAEFETNLRRERQMEGILKAKASGKYKGRKQSIDRDRVKQLKAQGMGASKIAAELGIARASVYRVLEEEVA
ncbi:MAG: recombinase family protein [Rhodospirillales bacterium]|nr:recombinase family protein [Rhodospirillales bacterium]